MRARWISSFNDTSAESLGGIGWNGTCGLRVRMIWIYERISTPHHTFPCEQ